MTESLTIMMVEVDVRSAVRRALRSAVSVTVDSLDHTIRAATFMFGMARSRYRTTSAGAESAMNNTSKSAELCALILAREQSKKSEVGLTMMMSTDEHINNLVSW